MIEKLLLFCIAIMAIYPTKCHQNNDFGFKLQQLDEETVDIRNDMSLMEERIVNMMNMAKESLRSEMKKQYVREEMLNSQLASEIRQLKQEHRQLETQLLKTLRDAEEDRNTYREAFLEVEREARKFKLCFKYVGASKVLQWNVNQSMGTLEENDINLLGLKQNLSNASPEVQLRGENRVSGMNVSGSTLASTVMTSSQDTASTLSPTMMALSTDTATPDQGLSGATTVTTTATSDQANSSFSSEINPERSRVLVVPSSEIHYHPRQVYIENNTMDIYKYVKVRYMTSVAYTSTHNKLLIGTYDPDQILSATPDEHGTEILVENVMSYGMAVDEERDTVFLTTVSPNETISRMTTKGENFTTLININSNYSHLPHAIAVDPKERKLYISRRNQVLMASYEGRILQVLVTGKRMFALTLDRTNNVLYYNQNKKIMKMSLSHNVTTRITTASVIPWNVLYYRDTVYFTSNNIRHPSHFGFLGAIDVGHLVESTNEGESSPQYIEQPINFKHMWSLHICLLP